VTTGPMRRARPLLGTLVEIRVEGLGPADAGRAIDRAFGEIAAVHRLMSFHECGSDLDRLHRTRIGERVVVDARTHDVLAWSLRIAAASAGAFDPTVAAQQVGRGVLPPPASAWAPHPLADWRDIELSDATQVRLARPLWVDLGGIAKGYAVDRALEILVDAGATQACVNAGGDLRVAGPRAELVHIRNDSGIAAGPSVHLADGALATSAFSSLAQTPRARARSDRFAGAREGPCATVSVAAPLCVLADALTKVAAVADADTVQRVLRRFGAQAALLSWCKRRRARRAAA